MKNPPRSKYLTDPFPMWQGCTFMELVVIATVTIVSVLAIALVISLIVGHTSALLFFSSLLFYPSIILVAKKVAAMKVNKPSKYLQLVLSNKLNGITKERITYTGSWDTRRTIE